MISKTKPILTVILLILSTKVLCSGLYFGASVGQSDSEDTGSTDLSWFNYTNINSESSDTKDTALSLYFGYEFDFTEFSIGVEAGWIDFGENTFFSEGQDFSPGGDGKRTANVSAEADALTVSAQAKKKVTKDISLFGRFGISSWNVSGTIEGEVFNALGGLTGSTSNSVSDSGTDPYFGFGLEYKFLRFETGRYQMGETDTDYLTLGIRF